MAAGGARKWLRPLPPTVTEGNSGLTPAGAEPTDLTDADDLDAFVRAHDLALVEFYTEGCSCCDAMVPVLGLVACESDAAVGLINPRDDPPLIERFDVTRVPTLVLFRDGEAVARTDEGFEGTEAVLEFVESNR